MYANPETGMVGIAALVALLLLGVPIGAALGLIGILGLIVVIGFEPALIKAGVTTVETLTRYELGTLRLFIMIDQMLF